MTLKLHFWAAKESEDTNLRWTHLRVHWSFIITKVWAGVTCPSTTAWIKKMRHTCTVRHCLAINRGEVLPSVATWMDLEGGMLKWNVSERQILYDFSNIWNPKKENKRTNKTNEKQSHGFRGWVRGRRRGERWAVEGNRRGRLRRKRLVTEQLGHGVSCAGWGQQSQSIACADTATRLTVAACRNARKCWIPVPRTSGRHHVVRESCFRNKLTHRKNDQVCGYQRRGARENWMKVVQRYQILVIGKWDSKWST